MNGQQRFQVGTWLPILSLDASAPFHEAMKLPLSPAYCGAGLRQVLEPCYRGSDGQLDVDQLAQRLADSLSAQAPGGVDAFRGWLQDVATIGWNDRPGWAPWAHVLHRWGARGLPDELDQQAWAQGVLNDYRAAVDMRPLRAQAEALRSGPLSDWDASVFARHRFYVIDEAEDGSDPFIPVLNTIEFIGLTRFHAAALAALDASRVAVLTAAARETAERMGLSHPASMHSFQALQGLAC